MCSSTKETIPSGPWASSVSAAWSLPIPAMSTTVPRRSGAEALSPVPFGTREHPEQIGSAADLLEEVQGEEGPGMMHDRDSGGHSELFANEQRLGVALE